MCKICDLYDQKMKELHYVFMSRCLYVCSFSCSFFTVIELDAKVLSVVESFCECNLPGCGLASGFSQMQWCVLFPNALKDLQICLFLFVQGKDQSQLCQLSYFYSCAQLNMNNDNACSESNVNVVLAAIRCPEHIVYRFRI